MKATKHSFSNAYGVVCGGFEKMWTNVINYSI